MLAGHYAPALALKRVAPGLPLFTLFLATQFLDFLFCSFVLLGIEDLSIIPGITRSNALDLHYMPWSHSAVAAVVWSGIVGASWKLKGGSGREAVVLGVVVASHYILDVVVHIPDMPIFYGDGPKLGLGLWNQPVHSLSLELAMIAGAFWWIGHWKRGKTLVGVLVVLGVLAYLVAPPNYPLGVAALGLGLFIGLAVLAGWAEKTTRLAP